MTKLQKAVYKQLNVDDKTEFLEVLNDVRNGGADSGFSGFTYYSDTRRFTQKNLPEILEELREIADGCGYETLTDCLLGFRCLRGLSRSEIEAGLMDDEDENRMYVYNALAWFALETVANQFDEVSK